MKFYEISVASDWPYNLYVCTYLDLFSLPLTYLNFPYLSFAMQVWVFTKKFRHVRGCAINFRTAKFWDRIEVEML